MADDTFFNEENKEAPAEETQTFKLGDKEYTQEEIQSLVGLGELAKEAETKYNTKIDKVFPAFTRATQERNEALEKLKSYENPAPQPIQSNTNFSLSEEQRTQAIQQLKDLGFVSKEDAQKQAYEVLQGQKLIENIDSLITDAQTQGNPLTTREDLLGHMGYTGIKDPRKAYKDLFETELDQIKEKKLASIKPGGMVTTEASTAGSKNPVTVKATRANLAQLIAEALPVN